MSLNGEEDPSRGRVTLTNAFLGPKIMQRCLIRVIHTASKISFILMRCTLEQVSHNWGPTITIAILSLLIPHSAYGKGEKARERRRASFSLPTCVRGRVVVYIVVQGAEARFRQRH